MEKPAQFRVKTNRQVLRKDHDAHVELVAMLANGLLASGDDRRFRKLSNVGPIRRLHTVSVDVNRPGFAGDPNS